MTERPLVQRYLGWCPRFREGTVFLMPQSQIPLNSRVILGALAATWAAIAFIDGLSAATHIYTDLASFQGTLELQLIFAYLTKATAGVLALALVLYFFATHGVNGKHRLLLNLLLADLLLQQLASIPLLLTFNFSILPQIPLYNQLNYILSLLDTLFFTGLLSYALTLSLRGRQILSRAFFASIIAYSAYNVLSASLFSLYVTPMRFPDMPRWTFPVVGNFVIISGAYMLVAYVSLSAYRQLRTKGTYNFTLSPVLKAGFLIYALVSISNIGWYGITNPNYVIYLLNGDALSTISWVLNLIQKIGIGAVALASINITVTELGSVSINVGEDRKRTMPELGT